MVDLMNLDDFLKQESIDLTNCDREPIHIPGSIQPHGILLVLAEPNLDIIQVSQNTERILGILPEELLGKPLSNLLAEEYISLIRDRIQEDFEYLHPLKLSIETSNNIANFQAIIHRSCQKKLIVELEKCSLKEPRSNFQIYQLNQSFLKLKKADSVREMCVVLVAEIRKIIEFDRVMVYRFKPDGTGSVIAEDKVEALESYLGLHYPDSDIPKQAKLLYTLNSLRLIPQVNYQPVSIIPNPPSEPLDLSHSILRSVSPIHIEYLKNMGVEASCSISLLKNQQLWGLIACHNQTPKFVPYEICSLCEFLGRIASSEIAAKEDRENWDDRRRLKLIQARVMDAISGEKDLESALVNHQQLLLDLVRASGVAVFTNGNLKTIGQTPSEAAIHNLLRWLPDRFQNRLFITDSLATLYPPAVEFKETASGLLALSITESQKNYILWFRPEIVQQVQWAGNPNKWVNREVEGQLTIGPRKSFELWQETVHLKSLPWQDYEIDGIIELRNVLVEICLHQVEELTATNLELERSNSELDSFAYLASHDLKEPLRGIHNYASFLLEDYADLLDGEGVYKLKTLVRLTQRMENLIEALLHFSRLGRQELKLDRLNLNEMVEMVSEVLRMSQRDALFEIHIPRPLPRVWGDRLLVEEVFTNLISNALKYNDRPEKSIEIGFLDPSEPSLEGGSFCWLYVKDNGIGIQEQHFEPIFRIFKRLHPRDRYGGGTGVGLTIVKKIIERQGGQIWVESTYGMGSTFYFSLPL